MLAGLQRSGNIFIGRVQASHDLRHHIDVGVMQNIVEIAGGNAGDLRLVRTDQNAADMKILAAAAPFVYTAAHHAEAQ